jgi:hypothetical protein
MAQQIACAAPHNLPMQLQLLSDLHLEVEPSFIAQPAPGADILILAGDVGGQGQGDGKGSKLPGTDPFGLERFSPRLGYWPVPVLYVPGNHEYDGGDFDATHAALRDECTRLGITWLERETLVLQGVRFVGTTLWSDFESLSKWPEHLPGALTRNLKMRDKAYGAANFYLRKAGITRGGSLMEAQAIAALSLECQAWLFSQLKTPFEGKTVVVTHFAPSLKSADPRFGIQPGTAGFCNALDDWLAHAQLWLHGHLHCAHDYTLNGCRVVANPLGYAQRGEQVAFQPQLLIKV